MSDFDDDFEDNSSQVSSMTDNDLFSDDDDEPLTKRPRHSEDEPESSEPETDDEDYDDERQERLKDLFRVETHEEDGETTEVKICADSPDFWYDNKINCSAITEPNVAEQLTRRFFTTDNRVNIMFTGAGAKTQGWFFNGIIWKEMDDISSFLTQRLFQELKHTYVEAWTLFQSPVPFLDNKQIDLVNKSLHRFDEIMFLKRVVEWIKFNYHHQGKIVWNANKNLWAFEDCIYDFEQEKFLDKSNPNDYINKTCGWSYNFEHDPIELANARDYVTEIVLDICGNDKAVADFISTEFAISMKGVNFLERMLFLLGPGRNGKGTVMCLFRLTLGDYYGTMEIEWFAEKMGKSGAPNPQLAAIHDKRVVGIAETDKANEKATELRLDKFKKFTGRDKIITRDNHAKAKSVISFEGPPIILECNDMPHIDGIHDEKNQSLQQRVVIVNFPHVYTNDIEKIRGEPNKYKQINVTIKDTIKGKDQALYRRAFFDILIDHLKQYQQDKSEGKDRELPEALKRTRAQYYADCDAVKISFFDTFEEHPQVDYPQAFERETYSVSKAFQKFEEAFKCKMSKAKYTEELKRIIGERPKGIHKRTARGIYTHNGDQYIQGYRFKSDTDDPPADFDADARRQQQVQATQARYNLQQVEYTPV